MRYPVVMDGRVNPDVLDAMGRDEHWLDEQLAKQGIRKVSDVYMARFQNGEFYAVTYQDK